jgi:hypothetical protein
MSSTSVVDCDFLFKFEDKSEKSLNTLVNEIAGLIEEIIEKNKVAQQKKSETSKLFEGRKTTSVSVKRYVNRLLKYFNNEPSSLVICLIYLDRLCEMADIKLSIENFHRIFLVSLVISIKYNEDKYFSNGFYAQIGGITLADFNDLESIFVNFLEFFLFVEEGIFNKYVSYLKNLIKLRSSSQLC